MELENILIENKSGILLITINTPKNLNCLDLKTLNELEKVIHFVYESETVSGAIITGAGDKSFVAGADINEFKTVNIDNSFEFSLNGQRVLSLIENCKKPFIAAVNGYALGGGCELAMACHLRVLSKNAQVGLPEVKLGIIPGYGGTYRFTNLIGRSKALEYMLTGKLMNSKDALQFGFANHVTTATNLINFCLELLSSVLSNSKVSIEMIIRSVNSYQLLDFTHIEAQNFTNCFKSGDVVEGIDAFLNKRKPDFTK